MIEITRGGAKDAMLPLVRGGGQQINLEVADVR
jgi:hypothetical protein